MAYQAPNGQWLLTNVGWGKARHIGYVLQELQNEHGRFFSGNPENVAEKVDFINSFAVSQVEKAHKEVCRKYNNGEISSRGRPPMSRNRKSRGYVDALKTAVETAEAIIASNGAATYEAPVSPSFDPAQFVSKADFNNHENSNLANFALLNQRLNNIVENRPTVVHIKPIDAPTINLGVQHREMPDLITCLRARQFNGLPLNVWLYGPAGTGKSMACKTIIEALGRKFYGNGKTLDKIEVMGYCDGYGKYHRTQFREAYEHGHGYCADEIDSWSPEATVALQGALAGDWCAFPDGMIKRHPDFIFIAAGNTTGKGATIEYVGRMQQDAAFLDRFIFQEWPHDDGLEDALVSNKTWLEYVRSVRANLNGNPDIRNHLVTMRASIHGEALLRANMEWDKVVNKTLRKGLPQNTWDKIK